MRRRTSATRSVSTCAKRGQFVSGADPDQQFVVELPPEPAQRRTHRGLADPDAGTGPGHIAFLQQRVQRHQQVQVSRQECSWWDTAPLMCRDDGESGHDAKSALDAAGEALDELLLREQIEHQERDHRQDDGGEDDIPLRDQFADEAVDHHREGDRIGPAEKDQRGEEVVPDDQRRQDRDGPGRRAQQREDDLPEGGERGGAVDLRRFFVVPRAESGRNRCRGTPTAASAARCT